jgi:hypothetical protein
VRARGKATAVAGGLAAAAAAVGLAGAPAAVAGVAAKVSTPVTPACSTDITGRGPGSAVGRHVEFSYTLAGGACRNGLYTLIIRNTYDPKQWAIFIHRGDGKSKEIFFSQDLPWTPTDPPNDLGLSGLGLCVTGVTTEGLRIGDIAPDPQDAPCEPLRGGTARAFH